jgi:DNA repair protein RadC
MHIRPGLAQQAHQLGRLVRRHAAGHPQHQFPALQLAHANGIIRILQKLELYTMAITDWPADERPRERLLARGAAALSDAELLALFLRVGIRGKSAVDLARDLLTHFGNLSTLCNASASAFSAIPGMGLAKYAQLQAVLELARRALGEEMARRDVLDSPATVRDWLRLKLAQLPTRSS